MNSNFDNSNNGVNHGESGWNERGWSERGDKASEGVNEISSEAKGESVSEISSGAEKAEKLALANRDENGNKVIDETPTNESNNDGRWGDGNGGYNTGERNRWGDDWHNGYGNNNGNLHGHDGDGRRAKRQNNGGWMAAVITLGVATLALATTTTYAWRELDGADGRFNGAQAEGLYELCEIVTTIDDDLTAARTATAMDRVALFNDVAKESEAAETVLERVSLDGQMTERAAWYFNNLDNAATQMLITIANGEELSGRQVKELEYYYATNKRVKEALEDGCSKVCPRTMRKLTQKTGVLYQCFDSLCNEVITPDEELFGEGANPLTQRKKGALLQGKKEITAPQATDIATEIFKDYNVVEAKCVGEAVAKDITLYNVQIKTDDGEFLAQITKQGGYLAAFDSFKECSESHLSHESCQQIAEEFLERCGYEGLVPVTYFERDTSCMINFAAKQGETVIYPDQIRVKVCNSRGIVGGVEAIDYILNHREREISAPQITPKQAQNCINGRVEVTAHRLCIIDVNGQDVPCYEFDVVNGKDRCKVFVNAMNGEEEKVSAMH